MASAANRTSARRAALPAVLLAIIIAANLMLGSSHSVSTLVVIVPMLSANLAGPRLTAVYGVLALGAWAALAAVDHQFVAAGQYALIVRVIGIVVATVIGVVASIARERREARLHRVERVAEVAQQAILAPVPSRIGMVELAARYASSAQDATVGGDFYAALPTPFGVRVLIGDVRGSGLPAVRFAAAVLGAFRERAGECADMLELLDRLDAAVVRMAEPGDFVTAALVQISDSGIATVVNAGHPAPLLLHGATVRELVPSSIRPPLGLEGTAVPVVHALLPDDRILLFTDGAVEGRRPSDRAFRADDAMWHDAIGAQTAEQTVDHVFRGVTEWAHGHLTDDVAVVSMRIMAPSELPTEPLATSDDEDTADLAVGSGRATV